VIGCHRPAGFHHLTKIVRAAAGCTLSLAILVASSLQGAQQPDQPAALVARARQVVDQLAAGEVEPIVRSLNDKMKAAIDAAGLRAIFPSVVVNAGAFKAQVGTRTESRNGMNVVVVACAFERANVDVNVVFDQEGRIAGLWLRPGASTTPYTAAPYVDPAAFRDEPVVVDAGGWPLPGTLTMPVGAGPFPGVVLVHGSGPNDRDGTFGPNKVFRDLAEGLASRGVAVLRYDKRTKVHAARVKELRDFTVEAEVVDDAGAAIRMLRAREGVKADAVFLLGHSLGGTLAPRIAAANPAVAGLILLAAATSPVEQAIVNQTRYLAMLDGRVSPEEQAHIDAVLKLASDVRALKASDPPLAAATFSAPAAYWVDLRDYRPAEAATALKRPMLVLQGERDYQVTMDDLAAWKRALGSRADVTFRSYPTLNHLFMAGTGPSSPAEYSQPGHVDEAVVQDIAAWVTRQRATP
jgi:hypothetical protein